MDVKDLRTESALSERNNDSNKYTQGGVATLQCNRSKPYQDIGSNSLAKAEGVPVRPCAVIGPDRVVPPPASNDAFLKKGSVESWVSPDNGYRRPPDYPHRLHQNPTRNISPRQTFQENMQRINVPPTYNAVRHSDSANINHIQDRGVTLSKNSKPNMAPEAKYCDVPYPLNALSNEPKNVRESDMFVSSVNPQLTRNAPHVWPPSGVNVNVPRTYSVNEPYQYPQYSCAGQRPVIPMTRPHRTIQEDPAYAYPDHYYRDAIGRLKQYPPMKERCPQPRYEYVGNYPGQFHPPAPIQPIKYDIPKSSQTHPYQVFPHFKYLDNRVPDPTLEGYQRSSHQPHFNLPYRTQVIHPPYAQVPGNTPQKVQPYPSDGSVKGLPSNKLHYDNSSKMYIDYENSRNKPYQMPDNYYVNDINRFHPLKNQMVMPNYPPLGMRAMPSQQYYIKENTQIKPFEYMPTFRNYEPHLTGNPVLRHAPQFSPNTLAISPTDSSNDTSQTHGPLQEDYGYGSQSSTTSVRSVDSGVYRLPHEYYKRPDFRYGSIVASSQTLAKTEASSKDNKQKQIDVRQFLQMWNEGEEENNPENNSNSKEIIIQTSSSDTGNFPKHPNNEDQLYVLGLVNVPSEELSKYEHIEKISKLPENIKGYNNLELFSRFEEAMESCNTSNFKTMPKDYQNSIKDNTSKLTGETLPRSVSPLDVEAKISQSVIHKEVGCNFEIKPCSPKMLNVEVAAPAQNILGERVIEKVSNPLSKIVKSPLPNKNDENSNCNTVIRQENAFAITNNPSCKMIRSPFASNNMDSVKTNYSLQDLEINSGVCLASLPRLDNEIELNFPEVNQQFINANKKDGFSPSNNCPETNIHRDSTLLDGKDDKTNFDKNKAMLESDKTFSKLSKYRKSKSSSCESSEIKSKVVRTDSVIIKNPENIKNIEDKILENSLNVPMNLSSQCNQWYNSPHETIENKDNDRALDFSLHKSGNDLPIIEPEKEITNSIFEINNSHILNEDVLYSTNKLTYQDNDFVNDISAHSKELINETFKSMSEDDSCIQKDQDSPHNIVPTDSNVSSVNESIVNSTNKNEFIKADLATPSIIQNNIIYESISDTNYASKESTDLKNDTLTSASLSESLILENAELESKNYIGNELQHTNVNDSKLYEINELKDNTAEELQKSCKGIFNENSVTNEKDNIKNNVNNCETGEIFNREENRLKAEIGINCQNGNDFEHDEISANLEKLFRDSNDDIKPPKADLFLSDERISNVLQKNSCSRSKELYSPWIQKLITYSEGTYSPKKLQNKLFTKSIFDPDENIMEHAASDLELLKKELSQDLEIDSSDSLCFDDFTKISALKDNSTNNRPIFNNTELKRFKIETDSLNDNNKKENKDFVNEHNFLEVDKLCTKNLTNLNSKKVKKRASDDPNRKKKKRKKDMSDLTRQISENYTGYSSSVDTNSVIDGAILKNDIEEISRLNSEREKKNNLECMVQKYTSDSSENLLGESRANKCHVVEGKIENGLNENVSKISKDHDVTSMMLDSSVTDLKISTITQTGFNKPIPSESSDISCSFESNGRRIVEKSSCLNMLECNIEASKKDTGKLIITSNTDHQCSESLLVNIKEQQHRHFDENTAVMDNISVNKEDKIITIVSPILPQEEQNFDEKKCKSSVKPDKETEKSKILQSSSKIRYTNEFDNSLNITSTRVDSHNKDKVLIADTKTSSNSLPSIPYKTCEVNQNQSVERGNENEIRKEKIQNLQSLYIVTTTDNNTSEADKSTIHSSVPTSCIDDQKEQMKEKSIDKIDVTQTISIISEADKVVCINKNIIEEDKINDFDSNPNNLSKNENEKNYINNKSNSNEMCENRIMCESSDNSNIICKDNSVFTKDQENMTSKNQAQRNKHVKKIAVSEDESKVEAKNNNFEKVFMNDIGDDDSVLQKNNLENVIGNVNRCSELQIAEFKLDYCSSTNSEDTHKEMLNVCSSTENDVECETNNCNTNAENTREEILNACDTESNDMESEINTCNTSSEHSQEDISDVCASTESIDMECKVNTCKTNSENTQEKILDACGNTKNIDMEFKANTCKTSSENTQKEILDACGNIGNSYIKSIISTCNASSENTQEKILDACGSTDNIDKEYDVNICKTNLENHATNIDGNYAKDEIEYAFEENNQVNGEIILEETLSKCDKLNNESETDTLIDKNDVTLREMPGSSSQERVVKPERPKILDTLSNIDNDTATDDDCACFDDSQINSNVENCHIDSENRLTTIVNPETSNQDSPVKRRLKRSFSDSALNNFKNKDTCDKQLLDNTPMWPPKRQKIYEYDDSEQQAIDENFCSFIQNRRNSISSFYNAENVSFCILIDNDCILTEENENDKICFAEVSEECITELNTADVEQNGSEVVCSPEVNELNFSDSVMLDYDGGKSIQESWIDDVACVETVVSDDIVDVDEEPCFSTDIIVSNYEESGIFDGGVNEITVGVNSDNEECNKKDYSEFDNTSESPNTNDNLYDVQYSKHYNTLYIGECLENILSESYHTKSPSPSPSSDYTDSILLPDDSLDPKLPEDKENICIKDTSPKNPDNTSDYSSGNKPLNENIFREDIYETSCSFKKCSTEHLPESSGDNVYDLKNEEDVIYSKSSSSPEVSSTTTFEEKSSIVLKITSYNGSRVSEINEVNHSRPRCKFTESKDYSDSNSGFPKRPLITKAAQKYIPPLKESIRDLKVKLPLPKQRLLKLKQLKLSKNEPKVVKNNILVIPKKQKPKPNFEDVLKNIDEIQIKMHKQNSKKTKNIIPKVVIKKNVNGSHYTSSSSKEKFNPDLTGRKWQPWVFIERNTFIDRMAVTNKTKAIFSHRKNTYVLAEKFKKYKSVSSYNTKFIISQPKTSDSSKGQLKYTIRLKHSN